MKSNWLPKELWHLGEQLRGMLKEAVDTITELQGGELMATHPQIKQAISLRNPYTDPLNILQAELLKRVRARGDKEMGDDLEKALMITMAGIAAGMRNTG